MKQSPETEGVGVHFHPTIVVKGPSPTSYLSGTNDLQDASHHRFIHESFTDVESHNNTYFLRPEYRPFSFMKWD